MIPPYGWVAKRTPPTPVEPAKPFTDEELMARALQAVEERARAHHDAVETALQWKGKHTPDHLVQAVLNAGTQLDAALRQAVDRGHDPKELATVARLHPIYVASLLDKQDPQRSFWL